MREEEGGRRRSRPAREGSRRGESKDKGRSRSIGVRVLRIRVTTSRFERVRRFQPAVGSPPRRLPRPSFAPLKTLRDHGQEVDKTPLRPISREEGQAEEGRRAEGGRGTRHSDVSRPDSFVIEKRRP